MSCENKVINGKPICFWSWNDNINKAEISRQMREFSNNRFLGVVIHARAGLRFAYMGEEWFECCDYAIEEAHRLGIEVWIYDENGWPSGAADGKVTSLGEEHQMKYLCFTDNEIPSPEKTLCAFRKTDDGKYIRIADTDAREGDLFCSYRIVTGYVDLLSYDTVKEFIKNTHEAYKKRYSKYFGNTIRGFFTDEPQIKRMPWSREMVACWQSNYGSDLLDDLWMLIKDSPESKMFRKRFRDLASQLFCKNYTRQIADWCRQNELTLTGHFATEDGLYSQMVTNCGVMRHYALMQMPGIDHLGNRNTSPVLEKQVSSIAQQLGKPEVISESFGGSGWNLTFCDVMHIWGRQSALGVTKPCFHLSAYSIAGRRKRDYPPFFSYQSVWWKLFPQLMTWINNFNQKMTEGTRLCELLIISPLQSVKLGFAGEKDDSAAQLYCASFRALLECLLDLQLDFELGDESILAEYGSITENGAFRVGEREYRTVIVPECEILEQTTVSLLERFISKDGKVYFLNAKPALPDKSKSRFDNCLVVANHRSCLNKWAYSRNIRRFCEVRHKENGSLAKGVTIHSREIDGGRRFHIWTDEDYSDQKALVCIYDDCPENKAVYLWDLQTDTKRAVPFQKTDEGVCFVLPLLPRDNKVIDLTLASDLQPVLLEKKCERFIKNCDIRLTLPNALTVDYCAYALNDGELSQPDYTVKQINRIYDELNKLNCESAKLRVRYLFECADDLDLSGIQIAAETEFADEILLNGNKLTAKADSFYIDRCVRVYDAASYVKPGINLVDIVYKASRGTKKLGDFESVNNSFFYPVEPEAIYVLGDFSVAAKGEICDKGTFIKVDKSGFYLAPPAPLKMGDLTKQKLFFYRGCADYRFDLDYPDRNDRVYLSVEEGAASSAEILINQKRKAILRMDEKVDITELLLPGKNEVTVRLFGTNRNLLGPHHHCKGVTTLVGPHTFTGEFGWEDFVNLEIKRPNTWMDAYSFIPFGCEGFGICFKQNKKINQEDLS